MEQVYFKDIEQVISFTLASAKSRIYVAVAWFTNEVLFNSLLDALQKEVEVKVLILDDILNRNEFGLDFGVLANNGADVRLAKTDKGTMHHKFCIIDNQVITGSYNWTYHANINNENIIVTDEPIIISGYDEQFSTLFNDSSPIKLPYEHFKWTEIKEGDFSELRRNVLRDIIAKNDENSELRKEKLVNLNKAYKNGNAEELATASLLPTMEEHRSITDVLTSRSRDYVFKFWEENTWGHPNDTIGHRHLGKWYFKPYALKKDENNHEYVTGCLTPLLSGSLFAQERAFSRNLDIYDERFILTIKRFSKTKTSHLEFQDIPEKLLCIEHAKLFFYPFPSPMYNKSQPRTWRNATPRSIPAINLLGIAKEVDGDNVVFYEGWDPQERGEKIMNEFFVK